MEVNNDPFPHIEVDSVWDSYYLERIAEEFPPSDDRRWKRHGNDKEVKLGGGPNMWGPYTEAFFGLILPRFIPELERLFGMKDLSMETVGGGYHLIPPGSGKLGIHTDFNKSPDTNLYRRLNFLTFLNHDWQDEGGKLELWRKGDASPRVVITPEFGRSVIFETSDRSWHGHPHVSQRWRKSVAAYFFSPYPSPGHRDQDNYTTWLH